MNKIIALIIGMMVLVACGGEIAEGINKGDEGRAIPLVGPNATVYDESYERSARSLEELAVWTFDESKGNFCMIDALARIKAVRADGRRLFIKVMSGGCEDFEGWIPLFSFSLRS